MPTIEQLWNELRVTGGGQRRVDASHPLDVYADYELPDRPGLVALCGTRSGYTRSLKALALEEGLRADGRWSLRVQLREPQLLPVFAALCRDIVAFTRIGIDESRLSPAVIARIDRWRNLLERDAIGLGEPVLRGLVGELLTIQLQLLPTLPAAQAVAAWSGPGGGPQDFVLPSGLRLEVKTIRRDAARVHINGLQQLDAAPDPLALIVVRVETTGAGAPGAVTAPGLISQLRTRLAVDPDALVAFDAALACIGWHEHPAHDAFGLRPIVMEAYDVDSDFPRLTRSSVPVGVEDADYTVTLPGSPRTIWRGGL